MFSVWVKNSPLDKQGNWCKISGVFGVSFLAGVKEMKDEREFVLDDDIVLDDDSLDEDYEDSEYYDDYFSQYDEYNGTYYD